MARSLLMVVITAFFSSALAIYEEADAAAHLVDWSDECSFENQKTCNNFQKGFIGFERHDDYAKAKNELAHFTRTLQAGEAPAGTPLNENTKKILAWKVTMMQGFVADIDKNGEKPSQQRHKQFHSQEVKDRHKNIAKGDHETTHAKEQRKKAAADQEL